jgi:hypothetical protein
VALGGFFDIFTGGAGGQVESLVEGEEFEDVVVGDSGVGAGSLVGRAARHVFALGTASWERTVGWYMTNEGASFAGDIEDDPVSDIRGGVSDARVGIVQNEDIALGASGWVGPGERR